jgi:Zinc dependent phospholipase C
MPTAGTHITILERLALQAEFEPLIGSPNAAPGSAEETLHKFAKLGAIGPDIFYALMDYNDKMQDFTNFVAKTAGSFECITDLTKSIDDKLKQVENDVDFGLSKIFRDAVAEFEKVFGYIAAIVHNGLMKAAIDQGFNAFPIFEARRQQDLPRENWFWADYLHYVRTGAFVQCLLNESAGNQNNTAFAMGYLTHYVTDVVGHPFVNHVVGAPWRHYWQRHHLVENFIDAYVWDRWHDAHEGEIGANGEQRLDTIRDTPNGGIGIGAPFTFARLNDHINVGTQAGTDPVDDFIRSICQKIHDGIRVIGLDVGLPDIGKSAELEAWARMMERAFKAAYPYPDARPPENLSGKYPSPDDIMSAYSLLRLYLRIATEEAVTEPEFPDIVGDVWNAVKKLWEDVEKNLGTAPAFPSPGGGFTLEALAAAFAAFLDWAVGCAEAYFKAAIDFIRDAIAVGGVLLLDSLRAGLYLLKKALFDTYRYFRAFLVRSAYAIPFTDELCEDFGGGVTAYSLWTIPKVDGPTKVPKEEQPELERPKWNNHYTPWIPPERLSEMAGGVLYELPLQWASPYSGGDRPDAFIEGRPVARNLLSPDGPFGFSEVDPTKTPFVPPPDYGSAIENCKWAFRAAKSALSNGDIPDGFFPDYNLDGDRGYGWPCWDIEEGKKLDPVRNGVPPITVVPFRIF